jgi:hypothetical protein
MTYEEKKADALQKHPDCKYAEIRPGMNAAFQLTNVVCLWPDEHSYLVGNRPKYEVEGYPVD